MDTIFKFLKEHGHIIAAVIAGTCALTAAFIRRDRRWERTEGRVPVLGLLLPPLVSLLIGGGCLAAEYFAYNIEPSGDIVTGDTGTILALGGCVLIAAGLMWGPYNLYRLITWPKPPAAVETEEEPPPSMPVASSSLAKAGRSGRRKPHA